MLSTFVSDQRKPLVSNLILQAISSSITSPPDSGFIYSTIIALNGYTISGNTLIPDLVSAYNNINNNVSLEVKNYLAELCLLNNWDNFKNQLTFP